MNTVQPPWIAVIVGALVTVALSVTLISPFLGGATAGYLSNTSQKHGVIIGADSGAIACIPILFFLFLGFAGFLTGFPVTIESGYVFMFVLPVVVIWGVGLSALGGYSGAALGER